MFLSNLDYKNSKMSQNRTLLKADLVCKAIIVFIKYII